MAAILKIQDGRHIYIWEIGNIGFLIFYATQFPKMYRFAMPTKLHSELDYKYANYNRYYMLYSVVYPRHMLDVYHSLEEINPTLLKMTPMTPMRG